MSRRVVTTLAALALAATAATVTHAATGLPEWASASAAEPTDTLRAPGVELLNEKQRTVGPDGRSSTVVHRRVMRVVRADGRHRAVDVVVYQSDTDKVREGRAWSVAPDGTVRSHGMKEAVDRELAEDALYSDARIRSFDLTGEVVAGSTCAFEWVVDERPPFLQDEWGFRDEWPVRRSRYVLTLPPGWTVDATTFDAEPIEPRRDGARWTWELSDLPRIPAERDAPASALQGPRLGLCWRPSAGDVAGAFRTWEHVATWMDALSAPQATTDAALDARVRDLTRDAGGSFAAARRLARAVQDIRYVSISTGLGRGSGYQPRPAHEVLARAYGDCKDKANLLRTMLRAAGIDAWLVGVYSGDRAHVREPWPTPQQFNHCIVALRAPDTLSAPAVMADTPLGRVLFFDPTDPDTPLGLLPESLEGSRALLVSGERGGLVRLPESPPEASRTEQTTDATLAADGTLELTVRREAVGRDAAHERGMHRVLPPADYREALEQRVTAELRGAQLTKIEGVSPEEGRFVLDLAARVPRWAGSADLVMFRAPVLADLGIELPDERRELPLEQEATAWRDVVRFRLPEGWRVEETPKPVTVESRYGRFASSVAVKDGVLEVTRRYEAMRLEVAPQEIAALRTFRGELRAALRQVTVLAASR